ncbi:MAG: PspA/IM30 family protein [Candidatus Omnitrophica bacterium]|nr:PspA/IM30 family protein [Candidatus Omnitrophota bacterium]
MNLIERISRLISANINHLLDQAEDPELMVKQMIRDMEGSIVELRRETVRGVARVKQIEKQIATSGAQIEEYEKLAKTALKKGEDDQAREILSKKIHTVKVRETLDKELVNAREVADRLKSDLARLEDQVQSARRKKEELIRRKHLAEANLRSQEATRKSTEMIKTSTETASGGAAGESRIADYEDEITRIESIAEAEREMLQQDVQKELDLQKLSEDTAIEEELKRLKGEI